MMQRLVLSLTNRLTAERIRRYPRWLFAATMIVFVVGLMRAEGWIESDGRIVGRDFLAFYMAGDMVRQGQLTDLYDPEAQEAWQQRFMAPLNPAWRGTCLHLNPPHYAWAMSALARLDYGPALMAWWTFSLLCFIATVCIWRPWLLPGGDMVIPNQSRGRKPADKQSRDREEAEVDANHSWIDIALLVICTPAWFQALAGGQNSFVSLLVLTGFCALLIRGRDLLAGLVLSLLAFKFQLMLVPVMLLLWKRRGSALTGVAIGGALTLAATVFLLGPEVLAGYLQFGSRLHALLQLDGFDVYKQHSWYGFFALVGAGWMSPGAVRALTLAASLLSAAILVRIWRGPWTRQRLPLMLSATLVANLLVSPHLFHYDVLLITLPAVLWVTASRASRHVSMTELKPLLALGFVWLCVSPMVADVTRVQLSPWLMLGWLIVALRAARAYPAADESSARFAQRDAHDRTGITMEPA